ncbi:GAF domain-containing protein [Microbacterium sp. NC79]|uniref:helix-turn-helix domain-containing protein n=1 Tax=Microbacterium sp. NC79 TaxID=2851009 RepID=UPI001C2B779B|nr:GAF domain-containing protein [Microbacterium sp. NC79]MBV0896011.1 GAF domain-containing protein [Microbacterium sp. NC79]
MTDLAGVLRVLAEGTPLDDAAIRAALPADAEAADELIELGRRVTGLRARSAELRALTSSLRDLLAIADAELLLQRIVDRAHDLIEVDVAYLSVYSPEQDELYVRAATGTTSPRFLEMVVPAGVGLASLAVRTQHPQWVEDYLELETVPHDDVIDEIVREEQLRSLLGAPLVVNGRVLGVLFAASREPHAFRPEEISLLAAFASQAALVLHQAQLLKEANDATAIAAERQHQVEWAASVHVELTRLVAYGHGADEVVGVLADALGRAVTFVDEQGAVISGGPTVPSLDPEVRAAIALGAESGRSAIIESGEYELVAPVIAAPARPGALLVARSDKPVTEMEQRTVERSAIAAALTLLRRNAMLEAEDRVRGELAVELIESRTTRPGAVRRAAARGFAVDAPWVVAAIPCRGDERRRILGRLHHRSDWLAAPAPGGVTALVSAGDRSPDAVADLLRTEGGSDVTLIVATDANNLESAAAGARSLWRAAQLARGLGIVTGTMDAALLAPYALLFDGDATRLAAFVEQTLQPVLEWDERRDAQLFDTLAALFDERWSLSAVARSQHAHLNTIKQRVARLKTLLGDDLDAPEARFRLELAVRIERARRAVNQP